ncbi:MAG: DUF3352 domain-containing protein [bacterium]|nr:DUF3352 domain-containing protein [bacterium]
MVRSLIGAACALTLVFSTAVPAQAQLPTIYELLPADTQAAVWVRDSEQMLNKWEQTQLAKLTQDKKIAPFFEEKRAEIEKRFMEAGWRINIKPEDLGEYATGQILVAWCENPDRPVKPYALALIADIDPQKNAEMMKQFEQQLGPQQVQKSTQKHAGVSVTKYVLPPRSGEFLKQDSFFATVDSRLLICDDDALIKKLIDRVQGNASGDTLAQDPVFVKGRELAKLSGSGDIEFFVRPLGFARVIRSIAGARSKSNTDLLAAFQKQGFDAIASVCGEVSIGGEELDVHHHGYVYAKKPLTKSALVLDFPNQATQLIPNFVGSNAASLLVTNWNAQEAFWAAKGIVDELAGTPGVFEEVIEGIKSDPNGPQIDIREVLPNFTNDVYAIADSKQGPADVDSRRNMIALRIRDAAAMTDVLNRAMNGEPDAQLVEFADHQIWQVVHNNVDEISIESDFSDFGAPPAAAEAEEEPWLSSWAITVHDDFLIFSSHIEMIQEAILQAQTSATSPLEQTPDYQRVLAAITQYFGDRDFSAWRILRSEKSYRVQYELFRQGQLKRSKSMLATILDRILQKANRPEEEIDPDEQQISGEGLPNFEEIAGYLQPGGFVVRSTDNGWEFGGLMLGESFAPSPDSAVSQASQYGTARVSNSQDGAKR